MEANAKTVLVIGAGVAGLSAALDLARMNVGVHVVESGPFSGGHARVYACKAIDGCVQCGACLAEDLLTEASMNPRIQIHTRSRVNPKREKHTFGAEIIKEPVRIDPNACTGCGVCFFVCPEPGALEKGTSSAHRPPVAINPNLCSNVTDKSCDECQKSCPEKAVNLDARSETINLSANALIFATGFIPYSPEEKPFGYGRFENVATNLELEAMLRHKNEVARPSDGKIPKKMAFFQCVGSRDESLGHLWCSKTCCPSSLRMARWIKHRKPDTKISFFYIDIQSFNKDFESFLEKAEKEISLIRAIPSDVLPANDGCLTVNWFYKEHNTEVFDMVVLSIGMTPGPGHEKTAEKWGLALSEDGFFKDPPASNGVFAAGAAKGPMTIVEARASGGEAAVAALKHMGLF